jgi:hypothetical protein
MEENGVYHHNDYGKFEHAFAGDAIGEMTENNPAEGTHNETHGKQSVRLENRGKRICGRKEKSTKDRDKVSENCKIVKLKGISDGSRNNGLPLLIHHVTVSVCIRLAVRVMSDLCNSTKYVIDDYYKLLF